MTRTTTTRIRYQNRPFFTGKMRQGLRRSLWAGVFLAFALPVSPSYAGTIDDILDRLPSDLADRTSNLKNKTDAIRDGVDELVGDVRARNSQLTQQTRDQIVDFVRDVQQQIEFYKGQVAFAAGNKAKHPNLVMFMTKLEKLLKVVLADAGKNVNLGVLTDLLNYLPENVLLVMGEALANAGIDEAFIAKLDEAADEAEYVLGEAIEEAKEDAYDGVANPLGIRSKFLTAGTACFRINKFRRVQKGAATVLGLLGGDLKIGATIAKGLSRNTMGGKLGGEGGVSVVDGHITTNWAGTVADILGGASDGLLKLSASRFLKIRHCETIFYQQTVLDEMCRLSRDRSPSCQEWKESRDANPFRGRPVVDRFE